MEQVEFWLVMAIAAIAVGLRFAAMRKRQRWSQERVARWEAFKKRQGIH